MVVQRTGRLKVVCAPAGGGGPKRPAWTVVKPSLMAMPGVQRGSSEEWRNKRALSLVSELISPRIATASVLGVGTC